MNNKNLYLIIIVSFLSCDNSKWQTIYGKGIDNEPKSIGNAIYFENENNGVVGGYTLISDSKAQNDFQLSEIATLFLTTNAGQNWTEIHFGQPIKQSIRNVYLHLDTLICQTDSLILFSTSKGQKFIIYTDIDDCEEFISKYLKDNKNEIIDNDFSFNGTKYFIKEFYSNKLATVIVCHGSENLTDYYFASYNNGKSWNFLQKDFGDTRRRFLLEDKFLYCYHFPLGLKRLKLK